MNRKTGWFLASGLLVCLVLAGVVSNIASSSPDGLDSATLQGCTVDDEGEIIGGECVARAAQEHQLADGPLADYGVRGVTNPSLSTGLSGVIGVLVTFGIGASLFWLVRRRGTTEGTAAGTSSATMAGESAGTMAGPAAGTMAGTGAGLMAGTAAGPMGGPDSGTMAGPDAGASAGAGS